MGVRRAALPPSSGVRALFVLGSALLQRIVQRHYHVLQRRLLARDYVALDLRAVDLAAFRAGRQSVTIHVPDGNAETATVAGSSVVPAMAPVVLAPMAPVYDKVELQRLLGNA